MDRLIYTFPLHMPLKFNTPLLCYGENVSFEYGGSSDQETYSAKGQIENGVAGGLPRTKSCWATACTANDLALTKAPTPEQLDRLDPFYMSYFLPWNSSKNYQLAKSRGFHDLTHEWDRAHHAENFDQIDSRAYLVHSWLKYPQIRPRGRHRLHRPLHPLRHDDPRRGHPHHQAARRQPGPLSVRDSAPSAATAKPSSGPSSTSSTTATFFQGRIRPLDAQRAHLGRKQIGQLPLLFTGTYERGFLLCRSHIKNYASIDLAKFAAALLVVVLYLGPGGLFETVSLLPGGAVFSWLRRILFVFKIGKGQRAKPRGASLFPRILRLYAAGPCFITLRCCCSHFPITGRKSPFWSTLSSCCSGCSHRQLVGFVVPAGALWAVALCWLCLRLGLGAKGTLIAAALLHLFGVAGRDRLFQPAGPPFGRPLKRSPVGV